MADMVARYLELMVLKEGGKGESSAMVCPELKETERRSAEWEKPEYAAKSTLEKAGLLELLPEGTKQIGEPGFSFVEYGMGAMISDGHLCQTYQHFVHNQGVPEWRYQGYFGCRWPQEQLRFERDKIDQVLGGRHPMQKTWPFSPSKEGSPPGEKGQVRAVRKLTAWPWLNYSRPPGYDVRMWCADL